MGPQESSQPAPADAGSQATARSASEGTTATYEQIANIYFERWHDRSAIDEHLSRFIDMMRVYGLADLPVFDIGCGPGFDADFFRRSGLRAFGMDLSLAMMKAGRPHFGGEYVLADMRRLPLAAVAGGLWVNASMLHVPSDEVPAVLRGFAQSLAPGGLLYLSLKAGQGAEWTSESHGQPLSRYFVYWQPEQLDGLLQAAGFQVVDGWLSPVDESTTWLIRFCRKRTVNHMLPLNP